MDANSAFLRAIPAGKRISILSIDGGGMRGVIPAIVLKHFEEQLQLLDGPKARVADYFDVVTGTSTGGIIGGILTAPDKNNRPRYTAVDALNFYTENGSQIFAKRCIPFLTQLFGPKYDATALNNILKENLQDLKIKDTTTELIVPAFDIKLMQPTYFSTSDAKEDERKNVLVSDVLRGTSAAPTYFSPYYFQLPSTIKTTRDFNLVDGGVGMNNPTHLSIIHILRQVFKAQRTQSGGSLTIEDYKSLLILSLGTGKVVRSYDARKASKWGILSWVLNGGHVPILDIVNEASADLVDYNLNVLFSTLECPQNYLRIQAYNLSEDSASLDNATSENIEKLKKVGEELLDTSVANINIDSGESFFDPGRGSNKDALKRFAEELSAERRARTAGAQEA